MPNIDTLQMDLNFNFFSYVLGEWLNIYGVYLNTKTLNIKITQLMHFKKVKRLCC